MFNNWLNPNFKIRTINKFNLLSKHTLDVQKSLSQTQTQAMTATLERTACSQKLDQLQTIFQSASQALQQETFSSSSFLNSLSTVKKDLTTHSFISSLRPEDRQACQQSLIKNPFPDAFLLFTFLRKPIFL